MASAALSSPELALKSCSELKTPLVSLDETAMLRFLESEDAPFPGLLDFNIGSTNCFPELTFESPLEEAGFIVLVHGLDFGSGFRHILHHRRDGQGAWLTIRGGLVALGKAFGTTVRASWLHEITVEQVKLLFDIDFSDLQLLAEQIHGVIKEYADVLHSTPHATLGHWTAANCQHGACQFVAQLVATFPFTFRDSCVLKREDLPVKFVHDASALPSEQYALLAKKAQLVASEIHMRFRHDSTLDPATQKLLVFDDYAKLSGFIDNVVVAVLRKLGVLVCTSELNSQIDAGETLPSGSWEEVSLRAKGLVAIQELVQRYNDTHALGEKARKLTAGQLCNYMWGGLGKQPAFRAFPRHLTPTTLFY